ncbi:MAG: 4Fe-4S binding protein [Deltaproteobacteria bacterium]|nr:4Fe-4S binding protein [Deltaproteobacteria bacterium]
MNFRHLELVRTIKDKCRTCYTCVRNCPAKAIRIFDGQAEVIGDRCIGCGNCVRVCTQNAKEVISCSETAERLLENRNIRTAALVAPSFPAEFNDFGHEVFVGMLRKLGFDLVIEVAFAADVVAEKYREIYEKGELNPCIEASCPGIVSYIEKYHPTLIKNLGPIVSPMTASSRIVDKLYGKGIRKIFIGPCIAKKGEASDPDTGISCSILFSELRTMFNRKNIYADNIEESDFDQPHGAMGRIYALNHGFLQTAGIDESLLRSDVISAAGQSNFVEAIREFEQGNLDVKLLEILCCQGCVMGAGFTNSSPLFHRNARVSEYAKKRQESFDEDVWKSYVEMVKDLDYSRKYDEDDSRLESPNEEQLRAILDSMGKMGPEDELNCMACGYETCVEHAAAIHKGLAEREMCLPYVIERLKNTVTELEFSSTELANTQRALMHSERLASMGQLAAGIAHEVNNPLGVILLYSHLLLEKVESIGNKEELQMIVQQTERCKRIVSGLLNFARQNKVARQPVHILKLCTEVTESLHVPDNIKVVVTQACSDPVAEVDRDQIAQVITNLITNSIDAMSDGGEILIRMEGTEQSVKIIFRDTGCGISQDNLPKIFTPFFTTKKIGKGTGLGLPVTYGIIKMHLGQINVESNTDPEKGAVGTVFTIKFPRNESPNGA